MSVGFPLTVAHYLYFPDQASAERVGARLRRDGFQVQIRPPEGGPSWLVLAKRQELDPAALQHSAILLEQLASAVQGAEYDGHEVDFSDRL